MADAAERLVDVSPVIELSHQSARLSDGRDVSIRVASTGDLAGIIDFFERLSGPSRYSRFFSPQPRLRRQMIERVVAPGADRLTIVAQPVEFAATVRHVVAVGGWVWVPCDERAEISIAVADPWQGMMLGTYVVLVVLSSAVAAGHTRFAAEVLGSNARMLSLLGELGMPARSQCEAGVVRVEFELPEAA